MRCDLPYKLKHKETGLYWKGGGIIPFTNSGLETSCWSKNGKSWNMKGHLSSAISNTFHKEYVRTATTDFYDYKSCDETYFRFSNECEIEFFQDAITIPFAEFRKDIRQPSKKVHLTIEHDYSSTNIIFGTYINSDKFLFYIVNKSGKIEYPPKKKYQNYKRRMKL